MGMIVHPHFLSVISKYTVKMSRIFLSYFLFIGLITNIYSQINITPYDTLPGINSIYKPAYDNSYPSWGKKLYQYPVNFNSIENEYQEYLTEHGNQKNALTRYYKIWSGIVRDYADEYGNIILPSTEKYKSAAKKQQKAVIIQDDSNSDWTFLGPKNTYWLNNSGTPGETDVAPWQVNVYTLDVFKGNKSIIYCGTETGYVNKTTDGGKTWNMLAKDYVFGGIENIKMDPYNSNIVYVSSSSQIHKSTDGGKTWAPMLTNGLSFAANHLVIDPGNTDKIIASTNKGIYISLDAGRNWTRKTSRKTYDVEIKPGNSDVIYALTDTSQGNFELLESVNGGGTFSRVTTFPSNIHNKSGGLLAVSKDNPNLVLSTMLSNNNTPFLYRGVYNTGTWTWSKVIDCNTDDFRYNNGQGYFDLVLEISPENEDEFMVGSTTLFKTKNGGQDFDAIGGYWGRFSIHPDIQAMEWLENGEVWVATDGGISYSNDAFETDFLPIINGLIGSAMWGFDQGWNEDIVVGGRYHNGNTAMADFYNGKALRMGGAESATGWVIQGKSRHVAFNDLGNGWIIPSSAEGNPEGRFIFSKYPNMLEYGGRRGNLIHHPNYFEILFLGEGNNIWKSTDMGVTFESLHTFQGKVLCMQMSITNPDVIYADIEGRGLYRSDDQGVTWTYKSALSDNSNGGSKMKGRTNLVISPYDENTIYACYSNGTWTADKGKVFRSTDGGDTWTNWTGDVDGYTKCLAIQPTNSGEDLVYLFTTSRKGAQSKAYYRKASMTEWKLFTNNYPGNFDVNTVIPFYRDGKIRLAGGGGVWESPLQEPSFKPILNPWTNNIENNCMSEEIQFDDHSVLNHAGATWKWDISPAPEYISDSSIRNPVVVLGNPGSYDVTLTVTQDGKQYVKTISNMVTTSTCPSIEDCDNPGELPKNEWSLLYVDSEETGYPRPATNAFDDDPKTFWHTRWSTGSDPYPHEIQIDLGKSYSISKFNYLPRQDGSPNGRIKDFELYFSDDKSDWGEKAYSGTFENTSAPKIINFDNPIKGRYMRLVSLSEVNGNAWTSVAELTLTGCLTDQLGVVDEELDRSLLFYPNPVSSVLCIRSKTKVINRVEIFSILGKKVKSINSEFSSIPTDDLNSGIYIVRIYADQGLTVRKLIKK
ncbi:MAG: hypothetical protein DSY82_07885 [Flavobacteriia bacterium]|nr:MAG: hypothetical protein DSY82_07885 [Flavobacteriia bacterium]